MKQAFFEPVASLFCNAALQSLWTFRALLNMRRNIVSHRRHGYLWCISGSPQCKVPRTAVCFGKTFLFTSSVWCFFCPFQYLNVVLAETAKSDTQAIQEWDFCISLLMYWRVRFSVARFLTKFFAACYRVITSSLILCRRRHIRARFVSISSAGPTTSNCLHLRASEPIETSKYRNGVTKSEGVHRTLWKYHTFTMEALTTGRLLQFQMPLNEQSFFVSRLQQAKIFLSFFWPCQNSADLVLSCHQPFNALFPWFVPKV